MKQESYFEYFEDGRIASTARDVFRQNRYAAFTVAELDDLLKRYLHRIFFLETTNEWVVKPIIKAPPQSDAHPADARAQMLIYLLENKLITL